MGISSPSFKGENMKDMKDMEYPSIAEIITEVINNPEEYCDEYIAICVRAQAAMRGITKSEFFYEEAEATIAYAAILAKLKKFW